MDCEQQRKPQGVGDIESTDDGFRTSVSVPARPRRLLRRDFPSSGPVPVQHEEYKALPTIYV